ncbi:MULTISPECIES: hypothetical protein [unclassified Hahella]|uniref:hypothetical protein n=1 Tax=unclassified Hahella TaxID=2624107 RepID=UPI000FDF639F|nr:MULTISPECIES: hypothetical protein [unclassified Hahella]AZZ90809.1 hypothetical protein ENC22_06250 [Hahella sp. KA22]MDG9671111.1 hypothetical protein [Hahella sp. CR1]QAY54179.1 hypothetical protein EUZ85_08805 [Hahella sp. KA22]
MSDKKQFAIVMLVSALFVLWILYGSLEIVFINDELKEDPVLSKYPYHFRVIEKDGRVAVMGTLHSNQKTLSKALRIVFPELKDERDNSRALLQAEKDFARMQAYAQDLVLKNEAFDFVRWELDENWLRVQGIPFEMKGPDAASPMADANAN